MKRLRRFLIVLPVCGLPLLMLAAAAPALRAADTLEELRDREKKVKEVAARVMPCVVAITSADDTKPGSGSGVVVSKDGLILTAAHVTQATGNDLIIVFPDGRRVKGTSLGANRATDAGMAKITESGDWPHVEIGSSDALHLGDWVIAMGHPGGFNFDRKPPVRLGRVWRRDLDGAMFTSCPLIGGDSGGPLFDLSGKVVGINSSIHGNVDMNRHVAIDTLRFDWDKLVKDQTWGKMTFNANLSARPITGAVFDRESEHGVAVTEVYDGLPAAKAGLKVGDLITKFDGSDVSTYHALQRLLGRRLAGEKIPVTAQRDGKPVELTLELAKRGAPADDRHADADIPAEPSVPTPPEGPRPYLGAGLENTEGQGTRLSSISPGSPAEKAGLQSGDLLSKINTTDTPDPAAAAEALLKLQPGDKATFHLRRGSEDLSIEVTLGHRDP
jgi:serine protease Do